MTTLQKRILNTLGKFDGGDKKEIARELVEVLEWKRGASLSNLIQSAMGRELSRNELFQVEVLELILRDDDPSTRPSFPDDYLAPAPSDEPPWS